MLTVIIIIVVIIIIIAIIIVIIIVIIILLPRWQCHHDHFHVYDHSAPHHYRHHFHNPCNHDIYDIMVIIIFSVVFITCDTVIVVFNHYVHQYQ